MNQHKYSNWHAVLFVVVLVASNVAVKVLITQ